MDDVLDIGNIEPSGGDIRRDEQRISPCRESVDVFQSLPLLHGSVKGKRRELQHGEKGDQTPNAVDAVAENDRSAGILFEEVEEIQIFLFQGAVQPGMERDGTNLIFLR